MPGEGTRRVEANMKAAFETSMTRYKEELRGEYDRMVGSKPVSFEERGKEWMTIAGDPPAVQAWIGAQAAIHGVLGAVSMYFELKKDGEKFVDRVIDNAKEVTGGPVQ